jgi:hypothetical protein
VKGVYECGEGVWSDSGRYYVSPTDVQETTEEEIVPSAFQLSQNYPNPFNPQCEIRYALPKHAEVNLSVYNVLGQKVKTLVDELQTAGFKTVHWNGKDDKGEEVSSGVYFYKLKAGDYSETKKMILLK